MAGLRPAAASLLLVAGLLTGFGLLAYTAVGYLLLVVLPGALTPLAARLGSLLTLLRGRRGRAHPGAGE